MLNDVRYGFRLLRRSPVFAAAAIATLALGIGATAAIFAVFERIVVNPLPISEPDRVVSLHRVEGERLSRTFVYPAYRRFREQTQQVFSSVAASGDSGFRVRIGNDTRLASATFVTEGYFEQLGIRVLRGRLFTADEYKPGIAPVAVVTDAFWRVRMASDPDAIGREIRAGDVPVTVVGIAPRGFRGLEIASPADLFMPLMTTALVLPQGNYLSETLLRVDGKGYSPQHWLDITARLRPGVSMEQAGAVSGGVTIDAVPREAAPALRLLPASSAALSSRTRADTTRFAILLAAVVSLVLLIGCANLAGLILARNQQRRREVAVRLALGGSAGRVVRLLLTESLLLSVLGGVAGIVVAVWMLQAMSAFVIPGGIELQDLQLGLTRRLLVFAAGAAVFTSVLTGLLPALAGSRPDLVAGLQGRAGATIGGGGFVRGALVAGQVALSLVLIIGAMLFLRSLRAALTSDIGADAPRIAYATVSLWGAGYDPAQLAAFNEALVERLDGLPGVEEVSYGAMPLVSFPGSTPAFRIDGVQRQLPQTLVYPAGPDYFATLGIRLTAGRAIGPDDRTGLPPVVVVNESFARYVWPGMDPLGRRIVTRPQGPELEVVGVARDGKYGNLREAGRLAVYVPWHQESTMPRSSQTIMVRTAASPAASVAAIQREIRRLDPALAIIGAGTFEDRLAELAMTQRIGASLLSWFSAAAFALTVVGVYGLIAYAVALRTHEIGIRIALGGGTSYVVRLMMVRALSPVVAGIAAGLAGAYVLSRLAGTFLFGIQPHDSLSFAVAAIVLILGVVLASYIPARRAARVDPMIALRTH
ncbi:MAG TPA: ADOP family duplicated permease [Vicinamibacterales bacterium]|nr:ADOP family duplicated permease [Vicinamibacterales bacterium]